MATYIYQGSTPTIRFRPLNGISVVDASLGEPTVAISQEDVFLEYSAQDLTIDPTSNTVSVTLNENDTLKLVDGVQTLAQLAYSNQNTGKVVRFPVHELTVLQTVMGDLVEAAPEPEPEPEPIEEPDEVLYDSIGEMVDPETYEDYILGDYEETYDDTLEPDPAELYDLDDVEPADPEEE